MTAAGESRKVIADRIRKAFRLNPALSPEQIIARCPDETERDEIRKAFAQYSWETIPGETLVNDPGALSFMTPQGFRALFPAYMLLSLSGEPDVELDSVVFALTPRADREAALQDRLEALSSEELEAVSGFLGHMRIHTRFDGERDDYDSAIRALEDAVVKGRNARGE